MEVIGFMGNMGCGKNYIAEKVFLPNLSNKPTLVMALADHFKVHAIIFENLPYAKVFGEKDESTRKRLQELGTEIGRDKFGDDIWIKTLAIWMHIYQERGIKRFLITDIRFQNEAEFIKKIGGNIIKIDAPDRNLERLTQETGGDIEKIKKLSNHSSETFIDTYTDYDYLLDNSKNNKNILEDVKKIINNFNKN